RGGRARKVERASDFLELYKRFTGSELGGLTVGLVGLGAVGRGVAARLAAVQARRLPSHPHHPTPPPPATRRPRRPRPRPARAVSLPARVTPETPGLPPRARLARLKPTAYFVNTARAALSDEDALYEMLREGRLAGAALDVLASEPLQPDDRFLTLDNVIVTP